ncbi:MAG: phosphoribosylaminoimidazolesuccinocarboxamide synthase [Phycisphaerales bacterium]|nr:phosphoribosylaminoimidazolesuccinocarboxamide synthase [Phycisphaerales bacterium]
MEAVFETNLPFPNKRQGKVRDIYDLPADPKAGDPRLLIIATDRISAFDVVLPNPIVGKGALLTQLSKRWFRFIEAKGLCKTQTVSGDDLADRIPAHVMQSSVVARKCEVVPIECVVRGYLDGSGWKEYQQTQEVCGVKLPAGLQRGGELPEPIFTPATKAEQGEHDENITFERACEVVGTDVMTRLRDTSMAIYKAARAHARERGIILADTKFEFGWPVDANGKRTSDELILIDEALTPDSSRYWPLDAWKPGGAQQSFDKQFVRDYLQELVDQGKWDKTAPGPELPDSVVAGTIARYREAIEKLWGEVKVN